MPGADDKVQVKFMLHRDLPQKVDRRSRIQKHVWEAAIAAMPPIFDIPNGVTPADQIRDKRAQGPHIV